MLAKLNKTVKLWILRENTKIKKYPEFYTCQQKMYVKL